MKNSSLYAPLINDSIVMCEVVFDVTNDRAVIGEYGSFKKYTYKADMILHTDDIVVVETRDRMSVARVVNPQVAMPINDDETMYRWVVAKVDTSAHAHRLAQEDAIIEQINGRKVESMREQALNALGITSEEAFRMLENAADEASHVYDDIIDDEDTGVTITAMAVDDDDLEEDFDSTLAERMAGRYRNTDHGNDD